MDMLGLSYLTIESITRTSANVRIGCLTRSDNLLFRGQNQTTFRKCYWDYIFPQFG